MNLIERAARRLGPGPGAPAAPNTAELLTPPPANFGVEPPAPSASTRGRQTQRQVGILDRLRTLGYATPGTGSPLAEEFRLIKRPLLDTAFSRSPMREHNAHLIMVTSAGPREGKTFTSLNLALSMASEHDVNVLLIDADVIHPSIPKVLGFDADLGMIDVVADPTIQLPDVLVRTDIENLSLLPAGRHTHLANELIASTRMERFISDISTRYADRIIIFDSPPVLARTEATVLARHVGQIVFVVEAERTTKNAVKDSLHLIDRPYVRMVLNKVPAALARDGFGQYGYYYDRGDGRAAS